MMCVEVAGLSKSIISGWMDKVKAKTNTSGSGSSVLSEAFKHSGL